MRPAFVLAVGTIPIKKSSRKEPDMHSRSIQITGATRASRRTRVGAVSLGLTGLALATSLLSTPASAQGLKGDPAAAAAKASMCIGCHEIGGYKTAFPTVYHVPKILHQTEGFISAALKAYRSGERSHPSMRGIAGSLSDQDIADLAAFYAQGAKP
ncbi:MAG: hypothetical protein R3E87_15290 [Burkholderiaceae bacterium]